MDCWEEEEEKKRNGMFVKYVLITCFYASLWLLCIAEKVTSLTEHTESRLRASGFAWKLCVGGDCALLCKRINSLFALRNCMWLGSRFKNVKIALYSIKNTLLIRIQLNSNFILFDLNRGTTKRKSFVYGSYKLLIFIVFIINRCKFSGI